jgi:hypothetical protein
MSIKLTEKQLDLLINALKNRVNELNGIINPLLAELAEHENFIRQHDKNSLTPVSHNEISQAFERLPWSKKIIRILSDADKFMSTNEIVAEIVNLIPELAEESSTRSSVASLLSRRTGKLFVKKDDTYGLIDWKAPTL